jgi:hypothetical protein
MRFLLATAVAIAVFTAPAFAQKQSKPRPWEKTDEQRRDEADLERAYNSAIKQVPEQQKNADPWAGVRATPPTIKPARKPATQ